MGGPSGGNPYQGPYRGGQGGFPIPMPQHMRMIHKVEQFITQWQLCEGVNITNELMRKHISTSYVIPHLQGPVINKWVKGVNAWL
jgi:hypothetical protein